MLQDVANGIAEKQYAKNMEVAMLKITLKPGQYVNIGDDIRVVFAGGTGNNIRLLIDAPREVPIARNTAVPKMYLICFFIFICHASP